MHSLGWGGGGGGGGGGGEIGSCVRDMAPLGKLETSLSYYNVKDLF